MTYTIKEWKDEGKRRFGDDHTNWKFLCPACGRINTGQEFIDAGAEIDNMYSTCIGRHNGKGETPKNDGVIPEHGCNWTAGGLLRTLGRGDIVITDAGKEVDVFAFAEGAA